MKRTIHIWDLPIEKIYISLEDDFRESFFDKVHTKFGSWRNAGEFLSVPRGDTTLATNWKKDKQCFPLGIALKICREIGIKRSELESKITEIKCKTKLSGRGGNSGKPLKNPKLPIKINRNFMEILGHICGDGSIVKTSKKGIGLKYINSEPILIENFQRLIKDVFGEVEPNVQKRTGPQYTRPNYYLQYPTFFHSLFYQFFLIKREKI